MDQHDIRHLLESVASGALTPQDATERLAQLPFAEVDGATGHAEARIDHHRALRCGFPEVVFCQGKTPEQVLSVMREVLERADVVLATRATQRTSRRSPAASTTLAGSRRPA